MIINLSRANNPLLFGNKAKGLFDLIKIGLKVPKGYAISFDSNQKEIANFVKKECSEKKLYVVRSSSSAEDSNNQSFAGLFDTFVGVSKKDLSEKIISVINMKDNQRIKEFCKKIKMPIKNIRVGVVVQELINSEVSGVCFTKDPVKKFNSIYVEAILGLGEYIVSGEVTPDRYLISKKRLNIIRKKISTQHKILTLESGKVSNKSILYYSQKMKDSQIKELSKGALKIERYYKKPMDIEFAVSKNKIYFLQARPITT